MQKFLECLVRNIEFIEKQIKLLLQTKQNIFKDQKPYAYLKILSMNDLDTLILR